MLKLLDYLRDRILKAEDRITQVERDVLTLQAEVRALQRITISLVPTGSPPISPLRLQWGDGTTWDEDPREMTSEYNGRREGL